MRPPQQHTSNRNPRSFADRSARSLSTTSALSTSAPYDPNARQPRYRNVRDDQGRVIAVDIATAPSIHQVKSAPPDLLEATRHMEGGADRTSINGFLACLDSNVAQTVALSRSAVSLGRDRSSSSPESQAEALRPVPPLPEMRSLGRSSPAVYRDPRDDISAAVSRPAEPRQIDISEPFDRHRRTDTAQLTKRSRPRPDEVDATSISPNRLIRPAPLAELPVNLPSSATRTHSPSKRETERDKSRRVARHARERERHQGFRDENLECSGGPSPVPLRTFRDAVGSSTANALMASTDVVTGCGASRRRL